MRRSLITGITGLVAAMAVCLPCPAGTGTVLDDEGKPIEDAQVCYIDTATRVEMLCANTDDDGAYDLMDSAHSILRVSAPGYHIEEVLAQGHQAVTLQPAVSLAVRVVEASTGQPLDESEVWVVYASAEKKGPFPTNRAGVEIRRVLKPGDVRVIARAAGYEESEPVALKLEAGKKSEAVLELRRDDESDED